VEAMYLASTNYQVTNLQVVQTCLGKISTLKLLLFTSGLKKEH